MIQTPDEILAVLDQLQEEINLVAPGDYDLRSLIWALMIDIQSSYRLAMNGTFGELIEFDPTMVDEVENTVTDYMVNYYGD